MMELIILGSGTAIPSARRGPPGLVICAGDGPMLFDPGPVAPWKLAEAGIDFRDVEALCFTHLHPDHTGGLVPLLFAARNPEYRRAKDLRMIGPEGTCSFYDDLAVPYGEWASSAGYRIEIQEVAEGEWQNGAVRMAARAVAHGDAALAYRVEWAGKAIVYSGDTDYCAGIVEISRGADLLVLECSFPEDRKVPGHLTPSWAGRIAAEAGVRKLLLTHFYPACDGADIAGPVRERYSGDLILAEDLMRVEV